MNQNTEIPKGQLTGHFYTVNSSKRFPIVSRRKTKIIVINLESANKKIT